MACTIDRETIMRVIQTLREIADCENRGFDYMTRIVGLTMLFEGMLNQPEEVKEGEQS